MNRNTYDTSITKLQTDIRRLEQEIKNLTSIAAAEAAEDVQENSWGTWLLSPFYKRAEESEEDKARKDRGRQERQIEEDMKERQLDMKTTNLKKEEDLLKRAKDQVEAANLLDDEKNRRPSI